MIGVKVLDVVCTPESLASVVDGWDMGWRLPSLADTPHVG